MEALPLKTTKQKKDIPDLLSPDHTSFPAAYFDGAAQPGACRCGFIIMINEYTHFSSYGNGRLSSNNKAEAIVLAGLLKLCLFLDIQQVSIFGDSKVLVDSVTKKNHIMALHLAGWR